MNKEKEAPISPHVVRHAVAEAHKCAARLLTYGCSIRYKEYWRVSTTQSLLAIDDLINFALHVRRGIELLGLREHFRELDVALGKGPVTSKHLDDPTMKSDVHFWDLLGRIVHSTRIGISLADTNIHSTHPNDDTSYPHHFWVKSNRETDFIVHIESMVKTYLEEIEPVFDEVLRDAGIISPNEEHLHLESARARLKKAKSNSEEVSGDA